MAVEVRRELVTQPRACRRVGEQLGSNPETLRGWVIQAEIHEGARPGATSIEAERVAELEREVRELRRANEFCAPRPFFAAAELERRLR